MPIVEDWLSSRFAFRLNEAEPYVTNGCGNAPPFSERPVRPFGDPDPATVASICGERGRNLQSAISAAAAPSLIPVGLPDEVNDKHNWAARGTLALASCPIPRRSSC